jgi:hypothetical protein
MKQYCAYGLEPAMGSSLAQPMDRLGLGWQPTPKTGEHHGAGGRQQWWRLRHGSVEQCGERWMVRNSEANGFCLLVEAS